MKMSVASGTSKFVSKKVRKVRWRPRQDSMQMNSNMFATGSWDDESNEVSLWKHEEGEEGSSTVLLASVQHPGDVTGLNWISPDLLVTSSSTGSLNLYTLEQYKILTLSQDWSNLHRDGGATCLSSHGESVATAGQDGRINVLNIRQRAPVKVYDNADSCSMTDLIFSRGSDLLSSNMRGQLKLFDLRANQQTPSSTFLLSNDQVAVTCLAKHPSQGHIVISGGENGFLAVWDLRQGQHPVTLLSAHKAPVSEVKFHPDQPDHIFTCSQGGELWHWNGGSIKSSGGNLSMNNSLENLNSTSPWLSSEAVRHKVETTSLVSKQPLPINSVDVLGHSVLFGGDNEAFYILNNIVM
ncbi:nucleoporin Nup43 isoform X1 [Eurytemora carolleeae]|uniref:nucleoporin Nup43 isoform X1 n=1 Tax=Eurytemora carolleeae TaxID=1294199 RepID=UPI000C75CD93|nr:nucleoporin Nup43 isoform X1 [Eurytemora carolleeae]XP_023336113.1 nucleoporin Nup43 isoform X1 [Eurytemora carolleeae]|eukprot:XP_023336112.1 nucleoporin Nup43-like isoform X1 [Eurytemora affinis]